MLKSLLGQIIQKAYFGCVFFNTDGSPDFESAVVADVNDSFLKITGCIKDQMLNKRLGDLSCPFFTSDFPILVKDALTTKVYHFVPSFGRGFHVEAVASGTELAIIVRDDTSMRTAYETLKQKQEQLKTLINATPDLICFKDSKGRWLEANRSNLEIFSLQDVDFVGKDELELAESTLPVYRESFLWCADSDERTWQSGVMSREEELIPKPDGTPRIFDVIKVPLYYDEEKTKRKGIVVLGRDITEQKLIQDEINRQSGLINSLFNAIDDLVFFKGTDGRYMGCNKAFEELAGMSQSELMGKTDHEIFEKSVADEYIANDRVTLAMMQKRQNEEWVQFKDGRKRLMLTVKFPFCGADGELKGVMGICRDITELHKKTLELQNINSTLHETIQKETEKNRKYEQMIFNQKKLADLGNMVSAIAHHWRQPLNALGLYVQDVSQTHRDGLLDSEYINGFETTCMNIICGLSSTIDNFGDFFKPESKLITFNVMLEVRDILKIYEAKMAYLGITFRASCVCGDNFIDCGEYVDQLRCRYNEARVEGYRDEFKQGFINILQNAVDAVQEEFESNECLEKIISVSIGMKEDRIEIGIFNNGKPIPAYVAERIFHPYFTTKGEGKGTGIGLYLTKNIVENYMNGRIFFENTENGVCFFISLPVKPA